jgi:hypothetical protein
VLVFCRRCLWNRDAHLEALVAGSCGDVPLIELRWRCSNCRSRAPAAGEAARVRWPAVISILKGKTDVTLRSATRCIAGGAA